MPSRPTRMRPEFRFTREGRVFVLATVGIGIGAVNTGNNLLYMVLGLLLGLILTSGVLSEIVLRGVSVRRGRMPRAFARSPALFELEVRNSKRRFPSVSFEVGDVAEDEPKETRTYVQELKAGALTTVVVERSPSRRGRLRCTELRVTTRFPFGLLEKARVYPLEDFALVYPALVTLEDNSKRHGISGAETSSNEQGVGHETLGLRPHREGDSIRDVHWRRSAAVGELVVRERARDLDPELVVRLNIGRPRGEEREAFEADVSIAASRCVDAIERGLVVRLETEGGQLGRASDRADLDRLLTTLAHIEAVTSEGAP